MTRLSYIAHVILTSTLLLTGPVSAGWWSPQANQPSQRTSQDVDAQQTRTLLPDGTWLLTGGGPGAAAEVLAILDSQTGAIVTVPGGLMYPRFGHTATLLADGTVLITGGIGAEGEIVAQVERFDPHSWAIEELETSLQPRAFHSATVLTDGRVLIVGGADAAGQPLPSAEVFDAIGDATVQVPSALEHARSRHRAELLADGRVLVTGGTSAGVGDEIYDPLTNAFAGAGRLEPAEEASLAASIPAAGETSVSLNVRISLRFSRALDPSTLNALSIQLVGPEGPVSLRVVPAEGGMLAFARPEADLAPGETYTVTVERAFTTDGQAIVPASFAFSTAGARRPDPEPLDDEVWNPESEELSRNWRTGRPPSPWETLPLLEARPGVTAVSGRVLKLNGQPLAAVRLQIGRQSALTDRSGRFLLEDAPAGRQELLLDGRSASAPGRSYGIFRVGLDIIEGRTNKLPYTNWMVRIDTAHAARLASPTTTDVVVRTPRIPGLELRLQAGTIIRSQDQQRVIDVSITPIPVDRPPFPLPAGVDVPIYFTIQPGDAYLDGQSRGWPSGAQVIYPNYRGWRAGTRVDFWHYDPADKGWFVYGQGSVSRDGRQVVPDAGVQVYEFTGAMIASPSFAPGEGPQPCNECEDGDPVDLGTGLFVHEKTDLVLPDVIPIVLTRTYRTRDTISRPFGTGTTHPYEIFLVGDKHPYTYTDLILADGARVHYDRISAGTTAESAVYEHVSTPSRFYKSKIRWNGLGWELKLTDGTRYIFPEAELAADPNEAALNAIIDRFGNTLTIKRAGVSFFGSPAGRITRITSPNGRWVSFSYDGSNRITQARDNIGRSVDYEYDASGRLWKVTDAAQRVSEYTYDSAGRMKTLKDARGIVYLTNHYDINSRVIQQTQADGSIYRFAYTLNASNKVIQTDVTDPRGFVRRVTFNPAGYWLTDIRALGKPEQQTVSVDRQPVTNFVLAEVDTLLRRTEYTFDPASGDLLTVTRMAGTSDAATTTATYEQTYHQLETLTDPLDHTVTFGYDGRGALTSITDPLNHVVTIVPNSAGQPISITDAAGTTELTYDSGDLVAVTNPLGYSVRRLVDDGGRELTRTDAAGQTTTFEYDALNLVTKITDPLQGVTSVTYDENGNLRTVTDPRDGVTEFSYDAMDRVEVRKDPLLREERFTYDLSGNLQQFTDRKGQTTTYRHDGLNRPVDVGYADGTTVNYTYDGGNRLRQIVDSLTGTIVRDYDNFDRLASETTIRGSISYTYDKAGRRETMTVAGQPTVDYSYDEADRLRVIAQGAATVGFDYDAADRRTKLTLPNGVAVEYDYDAASQLKGLTYKLGTTVLGTLTYAYDAAGRRTEMGGSWARTTLPAPLSSAIYDDANRLTQWNGTTLTYDDNGNLLSEGSRSYSWDSRNRLSAVGGWQPASFQYDAIGRRITKSAAAGTTEYLYDGAEAVQELTAGSPSANLLYGSGIDELLLRSDAAVARWLVADGLGSALALLDPSGAVQTRYTYGAFGATSATGEESGNTAQYTGRENDGTGLYYYRARYYSPRLQRFISEDPIGFAAGDPNLYAYVGNAPTMWVDPLGLDRLDRMLDSLQSMLDLGGLVPGLGEPLDLVNAGVSVARGDSVGAGLSIAAMLPVGGQGATAVKIGRRLTGFTKHGIDQVINRGVRPSEIMDTLRNCKTKPGRDDVTRYIGKDAELRLNSAGEVVTAIRFKSPGAR